MRILRKLSDWSSKAPAWVCGDYLLVGDSVQWSVGQGPASVWVSIHARNRSAGLYLRVLAGSATGPRAGRRLRLCMAGPYVATKYISGFQCGPIYGELAIILEFMYVFGLRNAQTSYETAVATVRLRQRSRRTSLWASLTRCAEHRTPWFR